MNLQAVKRLAPTKQTLTVLFSLSGNQCAFPACENKIFNGKNKLIAQVCHIEAALPDGERFNPDSSNEARRDLNNLVVLCYEHHQETNDVDEYKVTRMRELKASHEARFRGNFKPTADQIDLAFELECKLSLENIGKNTEIIIREQHFQSQKMDGLHAKIDSLFSNKIEEKGIESKTEAFRNYIRKHQMQPHCGAMLYDKTTTAVFWNDGQHGKLASVLPKFRNYLGESKIEEISYYQRSDESSWVMFVQSEKASILHQKIWELHPSDENWKTREKQGAFERLWTYWDTPLTEDN